MLAYWRYFAARERLRTYIESAERAQRLVGETEVLIRADERPASDLDLVAGNRAQKLTVVNVARQTLLDAKYDLGIAMGLRAGAIRTLGAPLTTFPETAIDCRSAFEPEARAAAVRSALAGRRDLAALRARRAGARLAWEGVLKDLRSRWDVVTRVGYTRVGRRGGFRSRGLSGSGRRRTERPGAGAVRTAGHQSRGEGEGDGRSGVAPGFRRGR